jgi:hypothetical protein
MSNNLGMLVAAIGALLAGEYYVLITFDLSQAWLVESRPIWLLLKTTLRVGMALRVLFLGIYLLWLFVLFSTQAVQPKRRHNPLEMALWLMMFGLACYGLLTLQNHTIQWVTYLYPSSFLLLLVSGWWVMQSLYLRTSSKVKIQPEKEKLENTYSFNFPTEDGWINVPNPFRGIFVAGGAGAGKSASIAVPLIQQAVKKGYCGLVYDFKFPTLAEEVNKALLHFQPQGIEHYILNFTDPSRSHRLNPLKPDNLPQVAYVEEYSQAIIHNLLPESIRRKDFWIRSATAILTAVIWFLKKHHPAHCTLPHAVNTILYKDYLHVMSMLATDEECADLVRSALTAIENGAENQIAGVMGSLQIAIVRINSPEIAWVLSGDDLDLDLNNAEQPKLLTLGSDASLTDAFSPVISCIATVALKQMNQPKRRHSFVLLDEGPTLFIPKLEVIPATARSNKVATVYMAQDFSQMVAYYGKEVADVIIANLNNQFYGRTGSAATVKHVSELFGKEEHESVSQSTSQGRSLHGSNYSQSQSRSQQERLVVRPQDVLGLKVGEFVGVTVESHQSYFCSKIRMPHLPQGDYRIPAFASGIDVQGNFKRIKNVVTHLIQQYPKNISQPTRQQLRL